MRSFWSRLGLATALSVATVVIVLAQPAPAPVLPLRTQRVEEITYFHARLPAIPDQDRDGPPPRVVAKDAKTRAVHVRFEDWRGNRQNFRRFAEDIGPRAAENEPPPRPETALEIVGQLTGQGTTQLLVIYPVAPANGRPAWRTEWKEHAVTLDFEKAVVVAIPKERPEPRRNDPEDKRGQEPTIQRNDLRRLWAAAQHSTLIDLRAQVRTDASFYGFAAAATSRKYRLPRQQPNGRWQPWDNRFPADLFATTTGAAAVAESLQTDLVIGNGNGNANDQRPKPIQEPRKTLIASVPGIDIAAHDWDKMMADQRPAAEPLAQFVPHDNYYVRFRSLAKVVDFLGLMDQWGGNIARLMQPQSRDYRLLARYQRQLCLPIGELTSTLSADALHGLAITGNDPYFVTGTDVAVIFHVADAKAFAAATTPFLTAAKQEPQLKISSTEHHGTAIESYVTPRREVSLHRATVGSFTVYANSLAGLKRALDAHADRAIALIKSKDFQYMRTIYRADDATEDGFAFLSDPFIRALVGPASKIKEKRRREALAGLYLLTNGALFTAWETGKLPTDQAALLASASLTPAMLTLPEGPPAVWDAARQQAVSAVYNTLHFATPLIELPIDGVTDAEAQAYGQFRQQYLGLWRGFFDPVGFRLALSDRQVKLDTYILPLVASTQYDLLRRLTGGGTVRLNPAHLTAPTIAQFLLHLSPNLESRRGLFNPLNMVQPARREETPPFPELLAWALLDPVGEWFLIRMDDSPVYEQLFKIATSGNPTHSGRLSQLVFQMPVSIGVHLKNPLTMATTLTALRSQFLLSAPGLVTWEPLEQPHKGIPIVRVQATERGAPMFLLVDEVVKEPFRPAVFYAMVDDTFYLSLTESALKTVIDQHLARPKEGESVLVNSSLYLAPDAAVHAKQWANRVLEQQSQLQARDNLALWYALARAGLWSEQAAVREQTAYQYLGFVPVSPDGSAYRYDRHRDEIGHARHGSWSQTPVPGLLAKDAPLARLLENLRKVRVDLRFKEDGIQTVLQLDR